MIFSLLTHKTTDVANNIFNLVKGRGGLLGGSRFIYMRSVKRTVKKYKKMMLFLLIE